MSLLLVYLYCINNKRSYILDFRIVEQDLSNFFYVFKLEVIIQGIIDDNVITLPLIKVIVDIEKIIKLN